MFRIIITVVTICLFAANIAFAAAIELPRSGQTNCYNTSGTVIDCVGSGQDGALQKGVAWPSPRFTDNGNGTVTDNLTKLIWLRNANCFGLKTWTAALTNSNSLASGTCSLSDGSTSGQWRLPNRKELQSLLDRSKSNPVLPSNHPFTGVQSNYYWSSSIYAYYTGGAWSVGMDFGDVSGGSKTNTHYVWPVRDGQ